MSDSVEAAIQRAAAGAAATGPATLIVIKEDRSIVVPTAMQQIAVQCDNEANVLHFVCPRNWADIDLATATLYINVVKPDKSTVAFVCTNVVSSEDTVTFDWVVTEPVTDVVGKLSFLVCARDPSDPGNGYRWHSNLCDSLFIAPGIACVAPSDTPDPPHIPLYGTDTTLTEPHVPADAATVGARLSSLSEKVAPLSGGEPYQQLVTDGAGNTQWEDRLAYETEPALTEILPEQNFTGMGHVLIGGSKLSIGQTYTVKFDNTEYECICVDLDGVPAIGNASIAGFGSDTGEPFLLGYVRGAFTAFAIDETNTHTVSVRGFVTQIVKIPAKFIDKNSSGYIAIHSSDTMTQQEVENYHDEISRNEVVFIIWGRLCIEEIGYDSGNGKMYLITQNSVRFSIAKNDDGLFAFSDRKISKASFPKGRSTGDHTAGIHIYGNKISIIPGIIHTGVGSTDTLFSVNSNGTKSKDFNVLGNGEAVTPALILYSSTENSKKRFRITVDDTGTISATEVTS